MYDSNSIDVSQIKKNTNDFSFISTVFDLGVNQDYTSQRSEVLSSCADNEYNNFWYTLSAIGQDVGDQFQENIQNFIDNISNIDLCKIYSLESLISFFGITYGIFESIQNFPLDIQKLLDILSIPREYFFNNNKVSKQLLSVIYNNCSCDQEFISSTLSVVDEINKRRSELLLSNYNDISLSNYLESNIKNLSNYWCNSTNTGISVNNIDYIDDTLLDNFISSVFYNFLSNQLNATYNDISSTPIYTQLSTSILSSYSFKINSGNTEEQQMRLSFNIGKSFDLDKEVDAYEYGLSTDTDYSENELLLIQTEISCRTKVFEKTPLDNATRYKYYRELRFKEYYDFVENQNINYTTLFENAALYKLDNSYFEISSNIDSSNDYSKNRLLSANDQDQAVIDPKFIRSVSNTLLEIVNAIRDIRHDLKTQCQKNFMKGTYALLYFVINEYLRNNVVKTIVKLRKSQGYDKFELSFNQDANKNEILTYTDPINYFNISCEGDISTDVTKRYWQQTSNIDAIGAIDTTNVFKVPDTVEYNNAAFTTNEISTFYYDILKTKFDNSILSVSNLSDYNAALYDFLALIFNIGADETKLDEDGNLAINDSIDTLMKEYKEKLFNYYTGISSGYAPYYYFTNTIHPSYEIHPYLSGFIENESYDYPIQNLTSTVVEDIISDLKKRIDKYLDNCGYLINEWRNPLATNSDYLTNYERSQHLNDKNYIDQVVDYDGIFYPYTILQCIQDVNKVIKSITDNTISCNFSTAELSTNYYYGLQFNNYNKSKTINQLSIFNDLLKNEATRTSPHCIYRYAIDIYGNAYILLKNCKSTDNEDTQRNAAGILWIRYHNNPIAFPAYIKNSLTSINNNDLAQLKTDENTSNNSILCAEVINLDFSQTPYNSLSTYNIQDFYISDDKKHVIVNINHKFGNKYVVMPAISLIDKEYDVAKDYIQFVFEGMSNKISRIDTIYNITIEELATYTYDKFFKRNNQIGAIYHKIVENVVKVYIPYVDIASATVTKDAITAEIPLQMDRKQNTDIAIDVDENNNIHIAYVITSKNKTNIINTTNFISSSVDLNDASKYIRYNFNNDTIVTQTAYFGNINHAEVIQVEDNESNYKYTQFYNTYTDNGFFGLLPIGTTKVNKLNNTILTYDSVEATIETSELYERGMLKFQLLGSPKKQPIDFKFVLPVRMFEEFANNDASKHYDAAAKLASYFDLHFGEDVVDYANQISSNTNITDPKKIQALFEDKIPTVRIQEEYFNEVEKDSMKRLYDETATYPYLWYSPAQDIPQKYLNPGKATGEVGDSDNFIIQVYPDTQPLSVSWYKSSNGKIQLDFNTTYYKNFIGKNYYNEKRLFLCLEESGQAGFLTTYRNVSKMNTSGKEPIPDCDISYYIKNISDEYPKFILVAQPDDVTEYKQFKKLITDNGYGVMTDDEEYSVVI